MKTKANVQNNSNLENIRSKRIKPLRPYNPVFEKIVACENNQEYFK